MTNLTSRLPTRHARIALVLFLVVPLLAAGARGATVDESRTVPLERAEPERRRTRARTPDPAGGGTTTDPVAAPSTSAPPVTTPPVQEVAAPPPEPVDAPPTVAAVKRPPPRPDRTAPPPTAGARPTVSEGSEAVYADDFPDPFVLRANGSWWAFSTQVGLDKMPVLRSDDLLRWERVGDGLARMPSWAACCHHWAPSVLQRGTSFVLYYTTRHRATDLQCISRAVSPLPQGPYVDSSEAPLICQTDRGGSIDPSPFVGADGLAYLLWKSEGTLDGEPTRLWAQRLREDGQSLTGPRRELLRRTLPWEFPIIEGPSMAVIGGRHHLLYSGNRWETADYAVGHAICDSPLGPCRRSAPSPILASRDGAAGPGGQEFVRLPDGSHVLAHHAWDPAAIGYPRGARMLHIAQLRDDDGRLSVGGPWRDGADVGGGLLDVGG